MHHTKLQNNSMFNHEIIVCVSSMLCWPQFQPIKWIDETKENPINCHISRETHAILKENRF